MLNWDEAELVVFPKLKPTTKSISLRLPVPMVDEIRLLANKSSVFYRESPCGGKLVLLVSSEARRGIGRR
jgi:hypothetical protein